MKHPLDNQTVDRCEKEKELGINLNHYKQIKAFDNLFNIILYATHNTVFTVKDLSECVLDAPVNTIQNYVQGLIKFGYLEKDSLITYKATEYAKDIMNVKGEIKP